MKKILLTIVAVLTLLLSSCGTPDYSSFTESKMNSYYLSETKSSNRYILYYYNSEDSASNDVGQEIVEFFESFDALPYYTLDTKLIKRETSSFGGYVDQPVIYVVSDGVPYETYTGKEEIETFINNYSNINITYDTFASQHISDASELSEIDEDAYLVFVYFESCTYTQEIQEQLLQWFYTRPASQIYFIDLYDPELVNLGSFEFIANSSPQLFVFSDGEYTDEKYVGKTEIPEYIVEVGNSDLVAKNKIIEYSYFDDQHLSSYLETLMISDNAHLEYYYSPYCSHCNAIKLEILNFFKDNPEIEIFFINTAEATGTPQIENFTGTPSLSLVRDNTEVTRFIGTIQIGSFIDDYDAELIDLETYTD